MTRPKLLVAGATGLMGRACTEYLASKRAWNVVGISRRKPDYNADAEFVSLDLLDREACLATPGALRGTTHLVHAVVKEDANMVEGWKKSDTIHENVAMLKNLVDAVEAVSPDLQHVTVIQGPRAYGAHLGSYDLPARESDVRHMPPNFYYDQEDYLRAKQAGKRWTWSILRPPAGLGFAVGSSKNLLTSIALYATICKELNIPCRFPGSNLKGIWQVCDTRLVARGVEWVLQRADAAGQIINLSNGDCSCWENLWPEILDFFGLPYAPPMALPLARMMADKEPVWSRIVARHGLQPYRLSDIAAWQHVDYFLNKGSNSYISTIKVRKMGFHDCVDTREAFTDWFRWLQEHRIIPA